MNHEEYWSEFEQTGSVLAYLQYACAYEGDTVKEDGDECEYGTGNCDGDGSFSCTSGRI